jgi:formate-dependent nitrite reductase cytochrome c552 subunit
LALIAFCGLFAGTEVARPASAPADTGGAAPSDTATKTEPLTRADIEYRKLTAPEPSSKDGTVNAADWATYYPYIVASMGDNAKNSYVTDYLEEDPYLVNIYVGYCFGKDYGSAR